MTGDASSSFHGGATHRRASVVIPAHNEEHGVPRLLELLLSGDGADSLDILVVCNGCTDGTVPAVRAFAPRLTLVETPVASKAAALALADRSTSLFPRVYIDADVEIDAASVLALLEALAAGALAAGPTRVMDLSSSTRPVRMFYRVWQQLPQVNEGLFGRGVIAVSELGHRRLAELPPAMSDDLAFSEAFADTERVVVPVATVSIRAPRTWRGLVRRRTRVVIGTKEAHASGLAGDGSLTSLRSLAQMTARQPSLAPSMGVFLMTAVAARVQARRVMSHAGPTPWLRDDSVGRAT